jgi:hypothetical protein
MLTFIYIAYLLIAMRCETVPAIENTWIECLEVPDRYQMAIEGDDIRIERSGLPFPDIGTAPPPTKLRLPEGSITTWPS